MALRDSLLATTERIVPRGTSERAAGHSNGLRPHFAPPYGAQMPGSRRVAPASTAAAAATPSTAKAKRKTKHSANDENRPDGVRWGDLQSGTPIMVS